MQKTALILSSLVLALSFSWPLDLSAQTEGRLHLRWRGETYAPSFYTGKRMVSPNSGVFVSVAAIRDSKALDLSGLRVFWYVNGELVRDGAGIQQIRLNAPEVTRALFEVRAEVPSLGLAETVEIPVHAPRAVIEAPLIENRLRASSVVLKAWPFFFNTPPEFMVYSWTVNGRPPARIDDPSALEILIVSGTKPNTAIDSRLNIRDKLGREGASASRGIYFNP